MRKAEIAETIINLVRARKTGIPVKINAPEPKVKESKAAAKCKAKIEAANNKLRHAKDRGEVRNIYAKIELSEQEKAQGLAKEID